LPYGSRSRRRDYHWSLRRLPLAAFRRLRPQRRGCRPRTRQTGKAVQKTRTCAEYLRQARYSLTAYFTRRGDSILRINRDYVPRYGCAGGDWTVFSKQLIELPSCGYPCLMNFKTHISQFAFAFFPKWLGSNIYNLNLLLPSNSINT